MVSKPYTLALIFLILGLLGVLDAGYLTLKHYTHTSLECSLIEGCEKVTGSEYAVIFGVPVALIGMLYYVFIIVCAAGYLQKKQRAWLTAAMILAPAGAAASAWFVYLQLAVIGAICLYCMTSAVISFALCRSFKTLGMLWQASSGVVPRPTVVY